MKSNRKKEFSSFIENKNRFVVNKSNNNVVSALPSGVYDFYLDEDTNHLVFEKIDTNSDEILPLPTPEFQVLVDQINTFLEPKTKEQFDKYGYVYKRSALLYGLPGTGKTCLVTQIANQVKEKGGIVLFNPDPRLIQLAFNQLNDVQPDTTTMVIFEELDTLLIKHEETLLSILDGEIQKSNVIYMATTNFIDKIPDRIKRPGRFSSVLEIKYPTIEARSFYLKNKGIVSPELESLVELTTNFSIDELKEVVLAIKCLNLDLIETIDKIRKLKEKIINENQEDSETNLQNNILGYNNYKSLPTAAGTSAALREIFSPLIKRQLK